VSTDIEVPLPRLKLKLLAPLEVPVVPAIVIAPVAALLISPVELWLTVTLDGKLASLTVILSVAAPPVDVYVEPLATRNTSSSDDHVP
jgi:hypothetical protein